MSDVKEEEKCEIFFGKIEFIFPRLFVSTKLMDISKLLVILLDNYISRRLAPASSSRGSIIRRVGNYASGANTKNIFSGRFSFFFFVIFISDGMDRWTKISVIRRTYSGKLPPAGADAICKTSSSTMRLSMQCHRILRLIILILVHHYVSFHKSIVLSTNWNFLEVRANFDRHRPSVREHVTNDRRVGLAIGERFVKKKNWYI